MPGSGEGDDNAQDDDQGGNGDYANEPEHASTGHFLFAGGLDNLLLCLLGVLECLSGVLVNFNHHVTLVMNLGIDLLSDLVDV